MIKRIVLSCLIVLLYIPTKSQTYFKKNLIHVLNDQLVLMNYSTLKITGLELISNFNTKNLYSYLLLIGDENGRNHQLIYQTNFTGNLEYIGLSNSIYKQFKCAEMSTWKFNACINKADKTMLNSIFIDEIIDCILMRINECE